VRKNTFYENLGGLTDARSASVILFFEICNARKKGKNTWKKTILVKYRFSIAFVLSTILLRQLRNLFIYLFINLLIV